VSTIYASRIGRPSYPLLSLFRGLLLGVWCPTAGGHVKNDRRGHPKSTYGYSVHAGVDEDGFIHRQSVTPGDVHDSQERETRYCWKMKTYFMQIRLTVLKKPERSQGASDQVMDPVPAVSEVEPACVHYVQLHC